MPTAISGAPCSTSSKTTASLPTDKVWSPPKSSNSKTASKPTISEGHNHCSGRIDKTKPTCSSAQPATKVNTTLLRIVSLCPTLISSRKSRLKLTLKICSHYCGPDLTFKTRSVRSNPQKFKGSTYTMIRACTWIRWRKSRGDSNLNSRLTVRVWKLRTSFKAIIVSRYKKMGRFTSRAGLSNFTKWTLFQLLRCWTRTSFSKTTQNGSAYPAGAEAFRPVLDRAIETTWFFKRTTTLTNQILRSHSLQAAFYQKRLPERYLSAMKETKFTRCVKLNDWKHPR
jgi:hypothetical protein